MAVVDWSLAFLFFESGDNVFLKEIFIENFKIATKLDRLAGRRNCGGSSI